MAESKDRFSVENYVLDNIIKQIDDKKFLGLGKGKADDDMASRAELFLFAMAIGLNEGRRKPLGASRGLVQDSAIPGNGNFYGVSNAMSLIFSLALSELRKEGNAENIHDLNEARKIAQEYANTGFYVIEGWLNDKNLDEETIMNKLISKMNKVAAGFEKDTVLHQDIKGE